jgi:hypothetical protein
MSEKQRTERYSWMAISERPEIRLNKVEERMDSIEEGNGV